MALKSLNANRVFKISSITYPSILNPFTEKTTFRFELKRPGSLELKIFSITGQVLSSMHRTSPKGWVELNWNGADANGNQIPPGLYYYGASFDKQTLSGKIVKMN